MTNTEYPHAYRARDGSVRVALGDNGDILFGSVTEFGAWVAALQDQYSLVMIAERRDS